MDLTGKVDLLKFLGAKNVEIDGQEGVFIPYSQNPSIYRTPRSAHASVIIRAKRRAEYGQTHFIVLALTQENAKIIKTSQIRKVCPILGSLAPLAASAMTNRLKSSGTNTGSVYQSNPLTNKGDEILKKRVNPWDFNIPDDKSDASDDIPL